MTKNKFLDIRLGFVAGIFVLVLGLVLPAFMPMFASAAILDQRSITVSNNEAGATGVKYELKLADVPGGIPTSGGAIIEFCDNSPIVGMTCTHPSGMTAASVSASSGTATDLDSTDHATIKWVPASAVSTNGSVDVTFSGITNPNPASTPYTFFARVTTYTSSTNLSSYTSASSPGTYEDSGGIALSINKKIGVQAYVMESMSFCVSGSDITTDCDSASLTSPDMILGEDQGNGTKALSISAVSTEKDYAQLSTNAAHGAVVNLQSDSTSCGGLKLVSDSSCGITAQNGSSSTIDAGDAKFGIEVGTPTNAPPSGGTAVGSLAASGNYTSSKYFIDYVSGDATGVTSTYGSALFNSAGAPVAFKTVPLTFAASASPTTPAGIYKANLHLIATGTF